MTDTLKITQIGTFTLDAERSFGGRCFESAAQYHTVLVPAGTYPIEHVVRSSGITSQQWAYVRIHLAGTVLESGYGAKRYDHLIGTADTWAQQPYKYELRRAHEEQARLYDGIVQITDFETLAKASGV